MPLTVLDELEKLAKAATAPLIFCGDIDGSEFATMVPMSRILDIVACVRAADAMATPALVGNRDRVAEYETARAKLEESYR